MARVPSPPAALHISTEEEEEGALSCSPSPSHGRAPKPPEPRSSPVEACLKSPGQGAYPNPSRGVKRIRLINTHLPMDSTGTWSSTSKPKKVNSRGQSLFNLSPVSAKSYVEPIF